MNGFGGCPNSYINKTPNTGVGNKAPNAAVIPHNTTNCLSAMFGNSITFSTRYVANPPPILPNACSGPRHAPPPNEIADNKIVAGAYLGLT